MEETKKKRIWDNYEIVGEIRKSDGIKFVVAAATREGFRYINIREFYMRKADGVWKPGRDGITVPLKAGLNKGEVFIEPLAKMLELLIDARDRAGSMELMDAEHAVWADVKVAKK